MDDDPAAISMPNLAEADEPRPLQRRLAIAELNGSLTGVYEPGYLDALRQDWPE